MVWILYIIADAIANWWLIEKKKTRPNYMVLFIIRGIAAIFYGIWIDVRSETILLWFLFVTLSFPFPFNSLLNLMRRKPLDYYGAESGIIDRVVVKHKLHGAYLVLTILMFAVSAFIWVRLIW